MQEAYPLVDGSIPALYFLNSGFRYFLLSLQIISLVAHFLLLLALQIKLLPARKSNRILIVLIIASTVTQVRISDLVYYSYYSLLLLSISNPRVSSAPLASCPTFSPSHAHTHTHTHITLTLRSLKLNMSIGIPLQFGIGFNYS
jgi:hypothetical protein